jgi:hypothetical protein
MKLYILVTEVIETNEAQNKETHINLQDLDKIKYRSALDSTVKKRLTKSYTQINSRGVYYKRPQTRLYKQNFQIIICY